MVGIAYLSIRRYFLYLPNGSEPMIGDPDDSAGRTLYRDLMGTSSSSMARDSSVCGNVAGDGDYRYVSYD